MRSVLYHGSQREHREAIRAEGLRPSARRDTHLGYICPVGVYLATDREEAAYFGPDVWAVDVVGLDVRVDPDSYNANGIDDNYYVAAHVRPDRLLLMAVEEGDDGE